MIWERSLSMLTKLLFRKSNEISDIKDSFNDLILLMHIFVMKRFKPRLIQMNLEITTDVISRRGCQNSQNMPALLVILVTFTRCRYVIVSPIHLSFTCFSGYGAR